MSNKSREEPVQSVVSKLKQVWERAAATGTNLPGEPTLAADLGVSRPAIREALVRLEERGYIHRRQGSETTVNKSLLAVRTRLDEQLDQSRVIAGAGATPFLRVVRHDVYQPTAAERERYDLDTDVSVLRVVKVWSADGRPITVATDSIPFEGAIDDLANGLEDPVFDIAERANGIRVAWETVWTSAVLLEGTEAWLLSQDSGVPALRLDIHGVGVHGETAYWARELQIEGPVNYALVRHIRRD
jgi:GntR family transcriptional regulator